MISFDLVNEVQQYLGKTVGLYELSEWLSGRLPLYLQDPESDDAKLAGIFELGLAEMDDDIATEEDLRNALSDALGEHKSIGISISFDAGSVERNVTGSANETSSQSYTLEMRSGIKVVRFDCSYT